ncbi:conserved hypothetical protein [Leishmania major strain Friedlin]|uniref:Methyltransferase domain-containing protein n=1 Tax=Leishmania major TaxID=5664 RepID=Q4QB04_LEIMA|nr:conserved hypothetical protein [Leishmania major strain Friedlin]CAJ04977.1 conserved hypothetical protein [Leishmania major strain Friedlin]|eukprot:XP_001683494.1 conserved hypothetical protein [Leishmania major strain Friedlin]
MSRLVIDSGACVRLWRFCPAPAPLTSNESLIRYASLGHGAPSEFRAHSGTKDMADLPFQWDDGNCISPFVASSEADTEAFAAWLTERYLSPIVQHITASSRGCAHQLCAVSQPHEMRLTDLGCGDAAAALTLVQHLRKGWCTLQGATADAPSPDGASCLRILLTGIDLDDALLDTAAANMSAFTAAAASPLSSLVSIETHLLSQDIRAADLNVCFPRCVQGGAASFCAPTRPPYVLYMYLLPDALALLREKLVDIMERGWVVASNRWPIPGLEAFLRDRAGNVHIYLHAAL